MGLATLNNFCQPIQRLPIEILGNILKQTFPHPDISWDGFLRKHPALTLPKQTNVSICHAISLSSVCRFWRDVIYLQPTFWAVIETHKLWSSHPQSIIDHFIPRTLDVPLQILDYNYSAWDVLQSNSRRLCRYILAVDAAPPASLSRTPISLPALECLSITNLGRWTSRHGIFDPLSLFAPEMPSLRRLLFRGVSSWTNLEFTGLTHLALCESHYLAVNVHQFLDLLRSCPLLESLVLRRWLPTEFRKGLHHNGLEVRLDQLSQLTVNHASMDSAMSLLSHLTLPPTVSVLMTVEECLTDGINFSTIPSSVPLLGDKSTILIM